MNKKRFTPNSKLRSSLHAESLLNIPLVQQMVEDPSVQFVPRALDHGWKYDDLRPYDMIGFNPLRSCIFYSQTTAFPDWLKQKNQSARPLNFGDRLAYEVLFAAHDYIHIWAYQAIRHLVPHLGFGTEAITERNIEDHVYCHLLTETAAVVGLDYWYLCQTDLNSVAPIGTNIKHITNSYHVSNLSEFQRFDPGFNPYDPSFFLRMLEMYLIGNFSGFSMDAIRSSPILHRWIKHELSYSDTQRKLTRQWLAFLSNGRVQLEDKKLLNPIDGAKPWKKKIARQLANLLWRKIVEDEKIYFKKLPLNEIWKPTITGPVVDFRFVNINGFGTEFWPQLESLMATSESQEYLFWQVLSKYRKSDLAADDIDILMDFKSNPDLKKMKHLLRSYRPIKPNANEGSSIFLAQ